MKKTKVLLPLLLVAISSPSISAENNAHGFYLGAGYGSFNYDVDQNWDTDSQYGKLIEKTEGDTLKVYAGYQFNRVIAIEATYTDYGDTEGYVNSRFSSETVKQSPTSISVAANAGYSFDNGLRPFALLGLASMNLNSSYEFLDTDSPIAIKYGFGLEYAPIQLHGVQLRVAFESDTYFAEAYSGLNLDADIYAFSLSSFYAGVSYKF